MCDNQRVLVFSDLHNCGHQTIREVVRRKWFDQANYIVSLGDNYARDLQEILAYSGNTKIIGVLGNHDSFGMVDTFPSITFLDNRQAITPYEERNAVWCGLSGSTRYKSGDWCMRTQEEAARLLTEAPPCDIFLSHDSGYGWIGDKKDKAHSGFKAVDNYIIKRRPKLHLFGHHHICAQLYIRPGVFRTARRSQGRLPNATHSVCVYGAVLVDLTTHEVEFLCRR